MHWLERMLVVAALAGLGCAARGVSGGPDPGGAPPPEALAPAVAAAPHQALTMETLLNAAYPLPEANGALITFTEGKFKGPVLLGAIEELRFVILDRVARGDLDGDGVEDAALLMVKDPTGETPATTLWAVINQGGVPDPRGSILLGEKLQVGAMSIEDLKILVDVVRPTLQEVQGAPIRRIRESYQLLGSRLERADTFR